MLGSKQNIEGPAVVCLQKLRCKTEMVFVGPLGRCYCTGTYTATTTPGVACPGRFLGAAVRAKKVGKTGECLRLAGC